MFVWVCDFLFVSRPSESNDICDAHIYKDITISHMTLGNSIRLWFNLLALRHAAATHRVVTNTTAEFPNEAPIATVYVCVFYVHLRPLIGCCLLFVLYILHVPILSKEFNNHPVWCPDQASTSAWLAVSLSCDLYCVRCSACLSDYNIHVNDLHSAQRITMTDIEIVTTVGSLSLAMYNLCDSCYCNM